MHFFFSFPSYLRLFSVAVVNLVPLKTLRTVTCRVVIIFYGRSGYPLVIFLSDNVTTKA